MESSAGPVSDAEQSVLSCSAPVEPEGGARGVSAAAAAEGLYAGHEIKQEIVVGPELIQQQDIALSMQHLLPIKEENVHESKPAEGAACPCPSPPAQGLAVGALHPCKSCVIVFDSKSSLSDRNNVGDPSVNIKVGNGTANAKKICFFCVVCGKRYKKILLSNQKIVPHSVRKCLTCVHCKKLFTYPLHSTLQHDRCEETPVSCRTCEKKHKTVLKSHKKTVKRQSSFLCGYCDKLFNHDVHLRNHLRKHMIEMKKPYSCDICNKRFTKACFLTNHTRIHTGEKPFNCDICNKKFTLKGTLNNHLKIHSDVKRHRCDVCSKQFINLGNLTRHMRVHTGEKPFGCDKCSKWFKEQSTLIRHDRIHTGEKPFNCDKCHKLFTQRSNLITHLRTHTGEKPFHCDTCDQRFGLKSQLTKHKGAVHKIN